MAQKLRKIKYVNTRIDDELYDRFYKKLKAEGWSIQEALRNLIRNYTDGRFDIEEDDKWRHAL